MSSTAEKSTPGKESSERRRQQNRQAQRNRRRSLKARMEHYDQLCSAMGIEPVSADKDTQPMQSPPFFHQGPGQDESAPILEVEDPLDSISTSGQTTPLDPNTPAAAIVEPQVCNPADFLALGLEQFDFGVPMALDGPASFAFDGGFVVEAPSPHVPTMDHASLDRPKTDPNNASTALHFAVNQRSREMVALLLMHGARVDVHDCFGETPLHLAVATEDCDVLKNMLQALEKTTLPESSPTWVDVKNEKGLTPLHAALSRGHTSATRLLLAAGADPNQPMPVEQSQ